MGDLPLGTSASFLISVPTVGLEASGSAGRAVGRGGGRFLGGGEAGC